MHGLINRSLQCFVVDTYSKGTWRDIARTADIGFDSFEALLGYDDAVTERVICAATAHLNVPREIFLEDLGTYLVSHPRMGALRRLLRLGGETFVEFLFSLEDLHDRARLAVADLDMPVLELRDHFSTAYTLFVNHASPGFGHVLVGVLRAMADDYGALAILDHRGRREHVETISVELVQMDFAEGRAFALAETV